MVRINQKSFNEDMGRYISSVRSKDKKPLELFNFGKMLPKKKFHEEVPDMKEHEVLVENKEPSWLSKVFKGQKISKKEVVSEELSEKEMDELENMEEDIENLEYEEENIEQEKEALMSKFLKKLRLFSRTKEPTDDDMVEECGDAISVEMDGDVRDILKVMHNWLERLPPHEKKQFKMSEDFIKYKELLKRYGLIK